MTAKKRLTTHNGRVNSKGKAYSAKHNDRNFDLSNSQNITPERSQGNKYWKWIKGDMSFEDAEQLFYEKHFSKALDEKNQKYIKDGHRNRTKTMEEYRKSSKSCPEETIYAIGNKDNTIDSELLWEIVMEHLNWERETFPNVKILDVALHVDEEGAPHIQERKVWIGHDKGGNEVVGQDKALKEMNIKPPRENAAIGRYNNGKIIYTKMCRDHLFEVARSKGIELEDVPKERSKVGLELADYKARQAEEREKNLEEQIKALNDEIQQLVSLKMQASKIKKPGLFSKEITINKDAYNELQELSETFHKLVEDVTSKEKDNLKQKHEIEAEQERLKQLNEAEQERLRQHNVQMTEERNALRKERQETNEKIAKFNVKYQNLEKYIQEEGKKEGQKLFDEYIAEIGRFEPVGNRLKAFTQKIRLNNGQTVYEAFEAEDRIRMQNLLAFNRGLLH